MPVTQKQIADWKKQHGDKNGEIFELHVDGKVAYLKKPDRGVISMASELGGGNQVKISELVLDACWLGGDEEIRTDDDLFMSVMPSLQKMVEIKKVDLKKT
jgi:hypothetical protein